jgi:hypothetical protein
MVKIGRFVTDPRAGSYCRLTLDSGEKLLVSHDRTGGLGKMSVALLKLWGFSSEPLFECSLDSAEGRAILARLTAEARAGSAEVTPLGALVNRFKDCDSLATVRARCQTLTA